MITTNRLVFQSPVGVSSLKVYKLYRSLESNVFVSVSCQSTLKVYIKTLRIARDFKGIFTSLLNDCNWRRDFVAKNILLLFLSDVKLSKDDKGATCIRPAHYRGIGETKTTNESAVRYLAKIKESKPSKIFYFATDKVKSTIKDFQENGKTFSHVSYFEHRISDDVDGDISEVMQPCDFNENADINQTMNVVIKMASMIQKYAAKNEEVTLHVDMTGGMRHASLMMLVIARLIQYSGVKIGYILYSNFARDREEQFVEEANEIYSLFDLISGAEEFVRFGSVEAILNYFDKKDKPDVLKDLLDAMKKFAEAIKISRRKEFHDALQGLKDAYEKFSGATEKFSTGTDVSSLNYNLMQQLKIRIEQEYSGLWKNDADDYVSIIDWCLNHGYIQQALVLYTEALPYQIVAKDEIISVTDTDLSLALATCAANDKMNREEEFLLLNTEFNLEGYSCKPVFKTYEKFIHKLKKAITDIRCNRFAGLGVFKNDTATERQHMIESDYKDYLELLKDLRKLKDDQSLAKNIETVAEKLPTLYSFWDLVPENIFEQDENQRAEKILSMLENTPDKSESFRKKFNNTLILHHMIENKMLKVNIADEEKFLDIIERYFVVKNERNDSVHAKRTPKELLSSANPEESRAALLKNYMKTGLEEYRNAIN